MVQKRGVIYSEKATEIRKKRRHLHFQKILIRILIVCLIYLLLGLVSSFSDFLIKDISVSGTETVDTSFVLEEINETLSGSLLIIFPKRNTFFYPKHALETILLREFPRLSSIDTKITNRTLSVEVKERKGEYLWCGSLPADMEKSADDMECYFADDGGYIFDRAPYFSGTVFFKFFGGDVISPIGSYILPEEEFSEVIKFKEFLPILNIKSATFFLGQNGIYELYLEDVRDITKTPKLIFNSQDNFETVLTNLTSALDTEPLKTSFKDNFDNLLYIDLRFKDQVVYKFK